MEKFITQKDEVFGECGEELYTGTYAYTDNYENVRCVDCYEKNYIGETYG